MKNRIISLVMALALVLTLLPVCAIADNSSEVDPDMSVDETVDIQTLIEKVKALIKSDDLDGLMNLLPQLDSGVLDELLGKLGSDDAKALLEMLKGLLNKEDGSIDMNVLSELLKSFIGSGDLDGILGDIPVEQLKALLEEYLKNGTLDGLKDLIPDDALEKLLGKLLENKNFEDLFGSIDKDKLLEALKGLFGGSGDGDLNIEDLLKGLDTDALIEALKSLLGDKIDIEDILGKLDNEQLKEIIKGLLNGDYNDFLEQFKNFDADTLAKILESLIGDNETLKQLLDKIDVDKLKDAIDKLLNGDSDIGDILDNLSTDKLVELFKQLMGDSETLKKLLEKLNSDQLGDIIKKLLEGGFDINGLFKNLDTYSILKAIAGLIGGDLDVDGPDDVTVSEGSSATFSVDVKTAGTYKYMWIEPDSVNKIDLGGIDLSGSKLELGAKLLQALKNLPSLSSTDSFTIAKTAASDNGRTFACFIYNISLGSSVAYVTDEAKLTVTSSSTPTPTPHQHTFKYKVCTGCGYEIPFPFTDVKESDWCYKDVKYVWQHDIMLGTEDTVFSPSAKMTRAMFVTVLYRMEGSPAISGMKAPAFTDVKENYWAHAAIVWAYNAGVTVGKTATTFDPNASITRAELVTMLYRYAGSPGVSGSLDVFKDASAIGAFARSAVIWASSLGVVNGYSDGSFGPNRTAQRSEMAAMLHRYMVLVNVG